MNGRFLLRRLMLMAFAIAVCLSMSLLVTWQEAESQTKVKLGDLLTGLRSTKLTSMEKKNELLAGAVRKRGVDFVLTPQIETILRAEGANDDLINAIRANSPKPKPTPTPTPVKTPLPLPTPTPTPTRTPQNNMGKTFTNAIGMEFVRISAGSFMMGSPSDEENRDSDEGPQHQVTISKDFYMGKYEVTQEEYKKVMGTNPSNFKNCPRCPVEQVSWNDTQEFIKRLNGMGSDTYRLPTEAEWEYACRAGTTTRYSFGDDESQLGYAWYSNNSGSKTHEVGTKQPNEWGLYDMHGNVWEWVNDSYDYDSDYYSRSLTTDPTGPSSGFYRVKRGGSWGSAGWYLRSAARSDRSPLYRDKYLGFRIIRE